MHDIKFGNTNYISEFSQTNRLRQGIEILCQNTTVQKQKPYNLQNGRLPYSQPQITITLTTSVYFSLWSLFSLDRRFKGSPYSVRRFWPHLISKVTCEKVIAPISTFLWPINNICLSEHKYGETFLPIYKWLDACCMQSKQIHIYADFKFYLKPLAYPS